MATRIEMTRRRFGAFFAAIFAMVPFRKTKKRKIIWIGHN